MSVLFRNVTQRLLVKGREGRGRGILLIVCSNISNTYPEKTAEILRRHKRFPLEKTSDKRAQKYHTDDAVDASSVWYFCARFSDVISRGNHRWPRKMSLVFSGYQIPSHDCFFPYTAWLKTFVPYWDPGSFMEDNAGKFQC